MNAGIIAAAASCSFTVGLDAELVAVLYFDSAFGGDGLCLCTGCMIDNYRCMYLNLLAAALLQFNRTIHACDSNYVRVSTHFDAGHPFVKRKP
ncbi:hypothetical protein D3C75_457980 [compost metagenome]